MSKMHSRQDSLSYKRGFNQNVCRIFNRTNPDVIASQYFPKRADCLTNYFTLCHHVCVQKVIIKS